MGADRKPATIRRYVSSVSTFHRAAGVANPTEALEVKLALKRLHRENGRAQTQAGALNRPIVERMLAVGGSTLRDLRNRALLAVAYDTLCRRSELAELYRADLDVGSDGAGTILVRRSRTDAEGVGVSATSPPIAWSTWPPGWPQPGIRTARCSGD
jgi:site-specific recombinase XerD